MKTNAIFWTVLSVILAAQGVLRAAGESPVLTLKVGDPAPKMQTGKWVQGEAVKEFTAGKAYLVEFWATWCGPCRVTIPHLNELHKKYQDQGLVVIGQNCWERDESLVAPFLEKMGQQMTYRVALDDKTNQERGAMAETWMAAAGRNGIPSAFLVDTKGRVAWIGHPMELQEEVIEAVLNGNFDIQQAAANYDQQQKNQAALQAIGSDLNKAITAKNWDEAEAKVNEAEKLLPEDQRKNLGMVRFHIALSRGDLPRAYQLAEDISRTNPDNALFHNQLAWQILIAPGIEERNLDLAEKLAARACAITKNGNPAILDTLARAYFMNGKKEKAIETQQMAIARATGAMKEGLQKNLESYQKNQLPEDE